MTTEQCYRCGKRLDGYFRQLCDECREAAQQEEAEDEEETR